MFQAFLWDLLLLLRDIFLLLEVLKKNLSRVWYNYRNLWFSICCTSRFAVSSQWEFSNLFGSSGQSGITNIPSSHTLDGTEEARKLACAFSHGVLIRDGSSGTGRCHPKINTFQDFHPLRLSSELSLFSLYFSWKPSI